MNNGDFRTLMMTPQRNDHQNSSESKLMVAPSSKPKKKYQPRNHSGSHSNRETNDVVLPEGYRDRAKERRDGKDPEVDEEQQTLLKTTGATIARTTKEERERIIEESKFLGGDMEHTHLVKGLDVALLQRTQEEIEKKDQIKAEKAKRKEEERFSGSNTLAAVNHEADSSDEDEEEKTVAFKVLDDVNENNKKKAASKVSRSSLALSIEGELFNKKEGKSEQFLPGRTSYIFEFNQSGKYERDIPSTIMRSKEDCSILKDYIRDQIDDSILVKLEAIMDYLHKDRKRNPEEDDKRKKRREIQSSKVTNDSKSIISESNSKSVVNPIKLMEIEDDDDDIFGDVGTYQPPDLNSNESKENRKRSADEFELPKSYFQQSELNNMEVEDDVDTGSFKGTLDRFKKFVEVNGTKGLGDVEDEDEDDFETKEDGTLIKRKEDSSKKNEKKGSKSKSSSLYNKDKDPKFNDDEYSECYPGTYESSFAEMEAVDDDEDISKMDLGKKHKLRRKEFASEEAWASYNETREATPKAAFQFGVKMSDGRKTKKNEGKKKEKAFDKELKKIQDVIKKKENLSSQVPTAQGEIQIHII